MSDTLDALQAKYDRLTAHRGRLIRYFDDCPDGDPRKADARRQLNDVGDRVLAVEKEIDAAITREGL